MATLHQTTTAEQLLASPGLGRCELVRGELIMMTPAGFQRGRLTGHFCSRLLSFVEQKALSVVTGAETGFLIAREPDTVRAPGVAFVRAERVPSEPTPGFFPGSPDLAVEVLSPSDRASEVLAKMRDWLQAGCLAVWLVDSATKTVSVCRDKTPMVTLDLSDDLSGDDVVPGFHFPVAQIFACLDQPKPA